MFFNDDHETEESLLAFQNKMIRRKPPRTRLWKMNISNLFIALKTLKWWRVSFHDFCKKQELFATELMVIKIANKPNPMTLVWLLLEKYARSIRLTTFLDTSASARFMKPSLLHKKICKSSSQKFRRTNDEVFEVNLRRESGQSKNMCFQKWCF